MTDTLRETDRGANIAASNAIAVPQAGPDHTTGAKIAENSGFLSVAAGVVGVVSYACTLLMANMLGTGDYTQFAAAAMLLGVVGIVASALVPLPLSHFVAVHPAASEARRDGMAFAVFVSFLAGIVAAVITGALTLAFSTPALAAAVACGSLAIFLVAAPSGWLQGELRFKWYALTTIGEVLLRLGFSLLVVAVAWGAVGAILGFALGAVALLVVPWSFYRDLKWRPRVVREKWRWAETSDIASVLCVVSVLVGIDVVVVAFLADGSAAAAGFQALATIAKGPVYVAAGTALVAFPLLRSPGVDVRQVLGAAFASFGQLAVVAFAIIATAPHALAGLIIPEKYHGSLELLPWLAAAGLGYAVLTVLATILLALRAYRRCQLGLACACLLVVGGLWTGWQVNAVSGMAAGSAIGAVFAAIVLALISWPVLSRVGPVKAAGGQVAGSAALLVILAVAGQLQPTVWLVLACISGVAVLAHQRGLLPAFSLISARRRSGQAPRVAGRRSKPLQPLLRRLAATSTRILASTVTAFITVVAVAFGVRAFGMERGFELWVDELLYVRLGESLSTGQFPTLPDGPFFLHPPGYFLLEAGAIRLFGISGDIVDVVLQLRWLNAALGALTVGLGFLVVGKLANKTAAWVAAVLLAFEPFILRNNSHAFLETSAMAAVLAGFLVLVGTREPGRRLPRVLRLAASGLLLGYAVLCKDFFVICTVGPVLVAVVWKKTLHWRKAAVVIAAAAVPYALYLTVAATQAHLPDWLDAKTSGLLRASGLEKSTGFTAVGSPSIVDRLIDQSGHFGTSYLLLALCPVAGALLCFSGRADRRLMGLAGLALGMAGAYSAAFGTFEEQYGYGVMVAGVLCSVLAVVELRERFRRGRRVLMVAGLCFVVLTLLLGLRTTFTVDNGFVQARDWARTSLPADARVSVTNSTAEFAFADDPRFGVWPSAPLMQDAAANYILTQSHPTSQGYGYANPGMLEWLKVHATPVFSTEGPTNGSTTIWFVPPAELTSGAAEGAGTPSKNYETER